MDGKRGTQGTDEELVQHSGLKTKKKGLSMDGSTY